jgi:hypothetical protein
MVGRQFRRFLLKVTNLKDHTWSYLFTTMQCHDHSCLYIWRHMVLIAPQCMVMLFRRSIVKFAFEINFDGSFDFGDERRNHNPRPTRTSFDPSINYRESECFPIFQKPLCDAVEVLLRSDWHGETWGSVICAINTTPVRIHISTDHVSCTYKVWPFTGKVKNRVSESDEKNFRMDRCWIEYILSVEYGQIESSPQ